MSSIPEVIGRNVRALRKRQGLTQAQVAHRAEIVVSTVAKIELGQTHASVRVLEKLARVLGTSVAGLTAPAYGDAVPGPVNEDPRQLGSLAMTADASVPSRLSRGSRFDPTAAAPCGGSCGGHRPATAAPSIAQPEVHGSVSEAGQMVRRTDADAAEAR